MIAGYVINEITGQCVFASDEYYWLKPGQVAFDVISRDGELLDSEQRCDSWAEFNHRLLKTWQIEKRPQGM